jgi:hypothetical protein
MRRERSNAYTGYKAASLQDGELIAKQAAIEETYQCFMEGVEGYTSANEPINFTSPFCCSVRQGQPELVSAVFSARSSFLAVIHGATFD